MSRRPCLRLRCHQHAAERTRLKGCGSAEQTDQGEGSHFAAAVLIQCSSSEDCENNRLDKPRGQMLSDQTLQWPPLERRHGNCCFPAHKASPLASEDVDGEMLIGRCRIPSRRAFCVAQERLDYQDLTFSSVY